MPHASWFKQCDKTNVINHPQVITILIGEIPTIPRFGSFLIGFTTLLKIIYKKWLKQKNDTSGNNIEI